MTSYKDYANSQIVNETTIAVRRQDYVNFYHTITDVYTVYLLCSFFRRDPKSVRILFLDAHPKGNLDVLWSQMFHSYTRLGHLKGIPSVFYRELIWSQPQPMSEIDVQRNRQIAPSFLSEFRQHILKEFNVSDQTNENVNCESINVFFLVRHNYVAHPRNPSGKITRQLSNEPEVLRELEKLFSNYRNIKFSYNHFENLSMEEQLKIIVRTDVFIGIHGAGLTHVLFLKSNRVLVELISSFVQLPAHYQWLSKINNVKYQSCEIGDNLPSTAETIFSCIKKQIDTMCLLKSSST